MMAQFHFLRPWWLLALVPLAWLIWRYWRQRQSGGAWQSVCDPHLLSHLLMAGQGRISRTPQLLLGCAGVLGILALAGPTWSRLPQPVYRNTAATVVLFNLSETMNAPDVTPTRLERARLKLLDFLRRQREGQTALIAYAGEAYVVSPLTDDAATIESLVTALQPNIMPVDGNNLAQALDKAEALLDQAGVYRGGRILLITDSAGGANARKHIATMQRKGRVLSILAVGTAQGAPITAPGGGFVLDRHGGILIPRLDRTALAELASTGHGHLVGITTTDADLNHLWPGAQTSRINSRQPARNHAADVWREQGPWLVLLVLPLVALAWRQGWLAMFVIAVMLQPHPVQASTWSDLWTRPDQQAYQALQRGEASTAAHLFRNPDWRSIAQYRAGNYAAAAAGFARLKTPQAMYNAANALAHLGKLRQAADNYRKVLQQQPDNQDARHNLKIVEDLLKRQQRPSQTDPHRQNKGQQHDKSGMASSRRSAAEKSGQQSAHNTSTNHAGQSSQTRQDSHGQAHPNPDKQQAQTHQPAQAGPSQAADKSAEASRKNSAAQAQQQAGARPQTSGQHHQSQSQSRQDAQQDQSDRPATGRLTQETTQQKESAQALQQWLRRIPDDPGGLLRRKFMYLHEQREQAANNNGN